MKYLTGFRRLGSLIFLSLFLSAPLQAVPQYEFTDIGALIGAEFESEAYVINNKGDVAGAFWPKDFTETEVTSHRNKKTGFIYRRDGSIEILERVDNQGTTILDMNDKGEFIGKWTAKDLIEDPTLEGGTPGVIYYTYLDESYFINRNGWVESNPLKSVVRINNNGDVLGEIDAQRGNMTSSIGILKPDNSVVDVLEGMDDCDQSIPDDCSGNNRLDFDVAGAEAFFIFDMNDKGQVYFQAGGYLIVYTPGQGYKKTTIPTGGYSSAIASARINNNGVFTRSTWGRRSQRFSHIFSSDGAVIEAGDFIKHREIGAINDSNAIVVTNNVAFSFTDQSELVGLNMGINDINNDNAVVGWRAQTAGMYSPVLNGGITIDGVFNDWSGRTAFNDAVDDGSTVNWANVWADEGENNLSFSYANVKDIDVGQQYLWNIYLDTDKQSSTGYNFKLLGGDYLLQGKNLYQYTGNGQDWSWTYLKDVDYAVNGARAELSIAKSALGLTGGANSYRALFYGTDPDGSNLDYLLVDMQSGSGSVISESISIPD
jgi:hypothetical protein